MSVTRTLRASKCKRVESMISDKRASDGMRADESREELLARILVDRSAEYVDRDEAALQLWEFDGARARAALTEIALDNADEQLADTAAQSLSEIWCRTGQPDWEVFRRLRGAARKIARHIILLRRPDWAERVNREADV